MNYEYINKIIEDVYSEFGNKYGDELNKLLTKEQKENETIDKIKEVIKSSGGYKGMCTQPQTDTFSYILELLEEIE